MAGSIARAAGAAASGGGGNGNSGWSLGGMKERILAQNAGQPGAAQQGGMVGAAMSVLGDPMSDGSTAGVVPAPEVGMPADINGADQFAGKKFEISPVQMKGSFSSKARKDAEGVYGSEEQRNNSLKR